MKRHADRTMSKCAAFLLALVLALLPCSRALAASATYTVTADKINLRTSPDLEGSVIRTIRRGETLELISARADGWLQVSYGSQTGYVSDQYVELMGISGSMIGTVIRANKLNIRATPDARGKVVRVAPLGATMTVDRLEEGFFHVEYDGVEGYASADYIILSVITSAAEPASPVEETVVPAPATGGTAEAASPEKILLQKGDRGASVRALQEQLIALGYLSGKADGDYGAATEAAVMTFQQLGSLTVTGKLDQATQDALDYACSPAGEEGALKRGDVSEAVRAVQQQLIALGYLTGKADGNFGAATERAVLAFQKARSLTESGVVDKNTLTVLNTAYLAIGSVPTVDAAGSALQNGSKGDAVKTLQTNLITLGYLTGKADGLFGSATEKAVKAFQSANGLTASGVADETTVSRIAAAVTALTQTPEPTATPAPAATSLKKGDKGEEVKTLQQQLITLGYLSGSADGVYGADTKAAVRAFQSAKGLGADGIAGPKTIEAISAAVTAATSTAPAQSGSTLSLKRGDKGEAVKALQTSLITLGYLTGSADGVFGTATMTAVKAFQSASGVTADGLAGSKTLSLLEKAVEKAASQTSTSLKKGSSGDAVKTLQKQLIELGYLSGSADGVFGAQTETALKEFQRSQGITADGVAGTRTTTALTAAVSASNTAPAQPGSTATELKYGDVSDAVKAMQTRLISLGYLTSGSADGEYGPLTEKAVRSFQSMNGLTVDGVAGAKTLAAINSSSAKEASAPTVTTSALAANIIATAKLYLGCPYVYATRGPKTFDCSGFTYFVFKQYGFILGNSAYNQGYKSPYPKVYSISALQPGDVVCFNTIEDSDLSDHVGIYIGDGNFIHASSGGGWVMISTLLSGYYYTRFSWGLRILS